MNKVCAAAVLVVLFGLGSARPAHAAAIGVFSWDDTFCQSVFSPCFNVMNLTDPSDPSNLDFLHLSVSILDGAGSTQTLYPGSMIATDVTLAAGGTLTTLDDLSFAAISFASLSLQVVPAGILRFLDENGNEVSGLSAPNTSAVIDFEAQTEPPSPVPEPGTLMLLGIGLATMAARRARQ